MADVAEGVRTIVRNRDLALLNGLDIAQTFTRGALTVFTVVVALDLLRIGEPGVGTLTAASFSASLLVRSRRLARWFGIGIALWGLPIALIPLFPREATALILLACVGFANALVDVGLYTLMARLAPGAVLARLFGLQESLVSLTVGLGAVFASLLIDLTSVPVAMVAVGALCPILVAATWHRLRLPDRNIGELDKEIGLLRGLSMLQPLPLPAIEQLARGLEPVHVPAGRAVFH